MYTQTTFERTDDKSIVVTTVYHDLDKKKIDEMEEKLQVAIGHGIVQEYLKEEEF